MKKYLFLLFIILVSCERKNEYIQINKYYSLNPRQPKFAIKINNLGEVYFCVEENPQFTFPGEESLTFQYFKYNNEVDWNKIKQIFKESFVETSFEKYDDISHSSTSILYKVDNLSGKIEDFDYLILNNEQESFYNNLINLLDTSNSVRVKFQSFELDDLMEPLPIPPILDN